MKKLLAMVAMAAMLTACGSSDDDNAGAGNGNGGSSVDAFFSRVMALIGSSPDDTEPVPIEADTATTSETAEPESVS